jgi:outer membrane lipoprotein-sorting protein
MNKRWLIGLSVLAAISLLLSGCQNQPTAEEIVARIKEVEASTEDAHGVLEVSVQSQGMDVALVVEVWEKKPNKVRAEVLESSKAEYVGAISVTDGDQVWMYDPDQNEVMVGEAGMGELDNPREMIQRMEGIIQLALDASEAELLGEEDVAGVATYKLKLTPKEGEDTFLPVGSEATLWVDQERWVVLQAHFSGDIFGEGEMRVRSFELNTGIADDRFQFEIPEGAQVINIEDTQPKPVTLDEARERADFDLLVPAYVPEGATLVDVFSLLVVVPEEDTQTDVYTMREAFVLYYDHAETSFTVMQGASKEMREEPSGEATEVTVRGQTGTLITDDQGNSFLTWEEEGVIITIAGHISEDEIVQVAESLQ